MNPAEEPMEDLGAELRARYRRLEPALPADEAADADPETAQVVRWMQGTWSALDVPNVTAPPARVSRAGATRKVVRRRRLFLAAAAALLLLAGPVLWRVLSSRVEIARPTRVAQVPARAPAQDVEVLAVRPDQIVLRSGPVRLVLLGPPPTESSHLPPGE